MIEACEAAGISILFALALIGAMVLLGYRLLPRDEERKIAEARALRRQRLPR